MDTEIENILDGPEHVYGDILRILLQQSSALICTNNSHGESSSIAYQVDRWCESNSSVLSVAFFLSFS